MNRLMSFFRTALGVLAASVLFTMMLLTIVDVVGRYLIGRPVPGAFEVTQVLMAVLIFTALPLVSARQEHVEIALFERVLPACVAAWRNAAVHLLGTAVAALVAWRLWLQAERLADFGDRFAFVPLSKAAVAYPLSALAAITAVVFAAHLVTSFTSARSGL